MFILYIWLSGQSDATFRKEMYKLRVKAEDLTSEYISWFRNIVNRQKVLIGLRKQQVIEDNKKIPTIIILDDNEDIKIDTEP